MRPVRGFQWPFRFANGSTAQSSGEQHIKENLGMLIGTAKGELLMRPDFGCDVHRRAFDPVNVMGLAAVDIQSSVRRYEPRVNINSVNANLDQSAEGIVKINVQFTIKGQTEPVTLQTSVRR